MRSLSKMKFGLIFHQASSRRVVKCKRGALVERKATRGAASEGFGVQFWNGRGVDGEYGEGGVFGAHFFDIVEALEIPGVHIDSNGVPTTDDGKSLEKISK